MDFLWGRSQELKLIARHVRKGGFGYITGRRRVGKSALLQKACEIHGGFYHQAVEGTPKQQLLHLAEEIQEILPLFRQVKPNNWNEFFTLLSKEKLPKLLVFDEFPYWVTQDPMLPSLLQKWIDHQLPKKKTLVLVSGSSQSMLYSQFLNHTAPLYGRTTLHLHLKPLSYQWFCRALNYKGADPKSFVRYSMVGGVPHYWKLMPKGNLIRQANELYFEPSAILSEEPIQLLRDEGITGGISKAILDFVGRGVSKPSELASRLGTVQGNLSRPLALLLELELISRDHPFGETPRATKKVLYRLKDPALAFYYGTFLPLRSRWPSLNSRDKERFLHQHASRQWENFCRQRYTESGCYWEGEIKIDLVAYERRKKRHLVAECKWKELKRKEEKALMEELKQKFFRTELSRKIKEPAFRIFSQKDLKSLLKNSFATIKKVNL